MELKLTKNTKLFIILLQLLSPGHCSLIHRPRPGGKGVKGKGRTVDISKQKGNSSYSGPEANALPDPKMVMRYYSTGKPDYVTEYEHYARKMIARDQEIAMKERKNRPKWNKTTTHRKPFRPQGRQALAGLGAITTLISGAVGVVGAVNGVLNAVTSLVNGVVSAGQFALDVAATIEKLVERYESRRGHLYSLVYEAVYLTAELCNVLVVQLHAKPEVHPIGWTYFSTYEYDKYFFGIWVMRGGYAINHAWLFKEWVWGFGGDFTNTNGRVDFRLRECPFYDPRTGINSESSESYEY